MEFWGVKDEDELLLGWFRGGIEYDKKRNVAPLIFDAWLAHDSAAVEMVELAAADFGLATGVMAQKTGALEPIVAFGGGVLRRAPAKYLDLLADKVKLKCPGARVRRPRLGAEHGACVMAAHADGVEAVEFFRLLEAESHMRRQA
jgi:hypothetical protein